jgi:hypothetical protein
MCDCYEDPEDQVEGFPEHANEVPQSEDFHSRTSDPRDFVVHDVGAA